MRLSVGLKSTLDIPSEKEKNSYKENAENIFVLREGNKIALGSSTITSIKLLFNYLFYVSVDISPCCTMIKGYSLQFN